jgi:hypothetical protein
MASIASVGDVLTYLQIADTATAAQRALLNMLIPMAERAIHSHIKYNPHYALRTEYYPTRAGVSVTDEDPTFDVVDNRVVVDGGDAGEDALLIARCLPVRSVVAAYVDWNAYGGQGPNDFLAETQLTAGRDFWVDFDEDGISRTGFIRRINATWPGRKGTVKLVYYSGYTAAEFDGGTSPEINASDMRLAAILAVVKHAKQSEVWQSGTSAGVGPLRSESISVSGHSVSYDTSLAGKNVAMSMSLPGESCELLVPYVRRTA